MYVYSAGDKQLLENYSIVNMVITKVILIEAAVYAVV